MLALLGQISGPVIAICAVVGVVLNWRKTNRLEALHEPDLSPPEVVHLPPLWPENPDWRQTPAEAAAEQAREHKLNEALGRAKQAASEEE